MEKNRIRATLSGICELGDFAKTAKNGKKYHNCIIRTSDDQIINATVFDKKIENKIIPGKKLELSVDISPSFYGSILFVNIVNAREAEQIAIPVNITVPAVKCEEPVPVLKPVKKDVLFKHEGKVVDVKLRKGGKSAIVTIATESSNFKVTVKGEEKIAVCEKDKHIRFNFSRKGSQLVAGLKYSYTMTEVEAA